MTRTTRRDMMGAGLFTALAGVAAVSVAAPNKPGQFAQVSAHPDAKLLALAAEFSALQKQVESYNRDDRAGEAAMDAAADRQRKLMASMGRLSARTADGQAARVRVLIGWYDMREGDRTCPSSIEEGDLWPLFRDILRGAAA